MDRLLVLLKNRAVQRAAGALLVAVFVTAFALDGTAPAPAPAPTAAPRTAAPRTAAPAPVQPAPAVGESDLKEPGDVDLGNLRGAAPNASSDSLPGCVSRFNTHNFSSRNGTAVRVIVPHYTVSPNRPGWGDVYSVADDLNNPAREASAHLIIDSEGHCLYTVPLALKAWTEAGGNSFSAGIEFVATGTEGKLSAAAVAKGGLVIAAIAKRENIPLRVADVTGCTPRRAGLADHAMFGACGGGHHDLRPFYGSSVVRRPADDARVLAPLIAAARSHGITATDRVTCRKLDWWRQHGRPHGKAETNAVRRRKALDARGVRCLASGPVVVG